MSTPTRSVPLQGATNFRDLGGYVAHQGRPVRWRRLFRSEHLAGLTAADQAELARLRVQRSFDFRGVDERAAQAYQVPGLRQHALSIEPTVAQRMAEFAGRGDALDGETVASLMEELYRRLVTHEHRRYAEWFGHLLADDSPLVFHCTAGKDRTGIAAALLLHALGVDADVIEHDYLLTRELYRRPHTPDSVLSPEAQAALWSVQARYLHAAWDELDTGHGGVQRYLAERIGLDDAARARLRALYLD